MSIVLKNGKVYLKEGIVKKDILIKDNKIQEIGNDLEGDTIEDVSGKLILPGIIDVHVHFREPGHPHKEDFDSGSKAAAAGGVTTILDMPNNSPPIISQKDVDNKKELAKKSRVNYGLYIGATSDNIDKINDIKDVVAIKVYMGSSTGNLLLDDLNDFARLMEKTNKLVVTHSENEQLIKYFSKKYAPTKMHHKMRENLAAVIATSEAVFTTSFFNKRLHIAHVTTKEEVDFLRKYKNENISCEVCPHHLFLNSSYFIEKQNLGKMNPPLRSEEDRTALWNGIKEGIIDIIATDHAPHTLEEKDEDFERAPCGVPGVQTNLPLLLNEVNKGNLQISDIARLCSENPARIFKLKNRGHIKEGYYADLVVVDLEKEDTITNEQQYSRCSWTPFHGIKIKGWPIITLVNGNIVYKENEFIQGKGGMLVELQD